MAEYTTQVTFDRRYARDGMPFADLARPYLAVLAAATGRPPITAEPAYEHESDWSDYDYPRESHAYTWGDEAHGLRAFASSLFVHHGRVGGSLVFWVFHGLPVGLKVSGNSKLHLTWHSHARLTVEDPARANEFGAVFRRELAGYDMALEPDGVARAALEDALSRLCWYGEVLPELDTADLSAAVSGTPVGRPAGAAARYLLAVAELARGQTEAAGVRFDELHARGRKLAFSHGIVCGRTDAGLPGLVAWQDDFPRRAAFWEVRSARAALAEARGDRAGAVAAYRTVAAARVPLTSPEAARQLARLREASS